MKITVETEVNTPLEKVWQAWISPEAICQWNYASEDWCCPEASIDLKTGGSFNYRMQSCDGSIGFDFEGEFTDVVTHKHIHYKMADDREVQIEFSEQADSTRVTETFDAEQENPAEMQRHGWQNILDHFKTYVESI